MVVARDTNPNAHSLALPSAPLGILVAGVLRGYGSSFIKLWVVSVVPKVESEWVFKGFIWGVFMVLGVLYIGFPMASGGYYVRIKGFLEPCG